MRFPKKIKNGKNQQKFQKCIFSLKYLILLTFKVKNQKKLVMFFSDFSHGITLVLDQIPMDG